MMRLLVVVLVASCFFGGCGQHGRMMDPNVVNRFEKGDLRSEVENKLGRPTFENLAKGGVCRVRYHYDGEKSDVLSLVPYVNIFAGGKKIRSQDFSITYRNNVIEECTYTDNTMTLSGGIVNMYVEQAPTPGANPSDMSASTASPQPK